MAIYHLSAKIVSRAQGQSVVASAAYRAADHLQDQRIGKTFDYSHKRGVEHAEILAPERAPAWVFDRERLWNAVEAAERRKDAQLARELEIALPVELTRQEQITLVRDYAQRAFVSQGMVVDVAIHRDNEENPHAHLLMTTRGLSGDGFGRKQRSWNERSQLIGWREKWAETANEHLLRAGREIRIDHRSLEAQGLDLVPGRKIGISAERQRSLSLPAGLLEKVAEQREIAEENGRRILEDPGLALKALTHHQATFTERDVAKWLHGKTDGAEQFQAAFLKVTASPELVAIGSDDRGRKRFTTKEMLSMERSLLERSERLAATREHAVGAGYRDQVLGDGRLSREQRAAFEHVTSGSDLAVVVGVAGAGKSTMLESARRAWEAAGYSVKGGALAGIAAENLETASGIQSRTLASWEMSWAKGRDQLTPRDVLVIDEAGLVGTRQLERVLESVEKAGAKVVLVGDPEQLQAIEAGAPFRGIAAEAGVIELNEVRRQRQDWQKAATRHLATGHTREALDAYEREQRVRAEPSRAEARESMLAAWRRGHDERPNESRLMLAYTRDDVHALNARARELRREAEELGKSEIIKTERGDREFAVGDRLYFLRNERGLGVKNGSLGTVEDIRGGVLQVRMDGEERRRVTVDSRYYDHLEHGYAATVHKSQGTTVDRTYVLATPHFDRHSTYVALSRHREAAAVFYGREDFEPLWSRASAQENFRNVLSRARPKELAHDYLDRDPAGESLSRVPSVSPIERDTATLAASSTLTALDRLRQRADQVARRLAAEREHERALETLQEPRVWERDHARDLGRERTKEHGLSQEHDSGLEL